MPPVFKSLDWSGDTPGSRLRQARIENNMTIRELAKAISISPENLGKLEADRFNASMHNLRLLSSVLGVSIPYLGCFENLPKKTLGQCIKKARLFHGLTKREFAGIMGVSEKAIWGWEQDQYKPLEKYLTTLDQYLSILNIAGEV
ncbi:helix-turn-helix transcriptional regulator [Desulforamulus aquiferis]|uniref:Helix-turn-helix transcriptional regulator n=1 Tax=Desulforamulus aquiferis TaxID=1397668 RepID=A0AAW7ZDH2_9FIRM|nr:helix-turn-helix transcriptional regulator [Desulforamulus aquiferis]MDO7787101.1 helix-turn-helix transcriptional regulator [Desulforamulus aquiferis]